MKKTMEGKFNNDVKDIYLYKNMLEKIVLIILAFGWIFAFSRPLIKLIPVPYLGVFEIVIIPWIYMSFLRPRAKISKQEAIIYLAIIGVLLSRIISLLGAYPFQASQLVSIFRYAESLLVIYVSIPLFRERRRRVFFLKVSFFMLLFDTVWGVVTFIMSKGKSPGLGLGWLHIDLQLLVVIIFIFYLSYSKQKDSLYYFALFCIPLFLLGILASTNRGILISFGISLVLIALFVKKKKKTIFFNIFIYLFLLSLIGFIFLYHLGFVSLIMVRMKQFFSFEGTISVRFVLWRIAWRIFITHPFTGIGSGGFARYSILYVPSTGNFGSYEMSAVESGVGTHNLFLNVLSETGLIGAIAYLAYFITVIRFLFKIIKKYNSLNPSSITIPIALAFFSYILNDFWGGFSFTPNSNILLALLLVYYSTPDLSCGDHQRER
ncbi:MAG: O-antigen ligase family protein [Brevinematia bacterium]